MRAARAGVIAMWVALFPLLGAAEPSEATRKQARERFDRGLKLFNQGDDGGALAEFQRAYDLVQHPLVLYNIALVYVAMKRPVDAVDAFDRVLKSPDDLDGERRTNAQRVRAEQAQRIGEITITANVERASIEVDGIEQARTPVAKPIRVASGEHVIGVSAPGYIPERRKVVVAGADRQNVVFELRAFEGRMAKLAISSNVPDLEISIDGKPVGRTPLAAPLALAPGRHEIVGRRAGYRDSKRVIELGDGTSGTVSFRPEPDPSQSGARGRLAVIVSESQPVIFVNTEPRGTAGRALELPPGRHVLRVERADFFPFERVVEVPSAGNATVKIELEPTPEKRAAYRSKTTTQRDWGWVALGAGSLVTAGSVGFLIWNRIKQTNAHDDYERYTAEYNKKCVPEVPECEDIRFNQEHALDKEDAANARYPFGWAGLGLGLAGAGVGIYFLVSNDDPNRYEPRPESDVFGRLKIRPSLAVDQRSGAIGFRGSF